MPLNLVFLGLNAFLSLFETAIGKEKLFESIYNDNNFNFSVGSLVDSSKNPSFGQLKVDKKEKLFLSLKIFADKQYDYDQNIYLAEGNVKAIINSGILRSDSLSYDRSTGILSAQGDVSFKKGGQYFIGNEFRYDLIKKEGIIKDTYGILDIKNVFNDLKIDKNIKEILVRNSSINKLNKKEKNIYKDGIEYTIGNIKLPKNKITRSNKSIGSINNWRFKSDLIIIQENGWSSNRINFTNDPFDPHQISFEGIDVIAEEDDGHLIITSSRTNLILERRTKIFLGKRIFGRRKKRTNKFELMIDSKDRDGLVLIRKSDTTRINNNINLDFQPQFLINRAFKGKTNSYQKQKNEDKKNINFSDLFGLNLKLNVNSKNWRFDSINDISTFNTTRFFSGLRHSSSFSKYLNLPVLEDSSFNIFTTYRSRAWNGTIGETEIKAAYGGFIEKNKSFKLGKVNNNLNLRFGTAEYEAEKYTDNEMIRLWRTSIFASLDSEYDIWKINQQKLMKKKKNYLSPIFIKPELVLRTNIHSAYFKYDEGWDQSFIKLSIGPEIRLGKLERNFLDYTKLSVMPGIKIKAGNSPFKFDNAIDLKTLNISYLQQIYGPLMVDIISNLNIDNNSENYGEYYDTKLGILWHKRAYEFGIYYQPNNDAGGIYFRLNGFEFGNSVNPVF